MELIKNQLFNPDEYSKEEVEATKWTLYTVGLRLLQLFAPYLPYVTETIYHELYKKSVGVASIHQTKFENIQKDMPFKAAQETMAIVIRIISEVRKLKTNQQLSLKTSLTSLTISSENDVKNRLSPYEQLLKGVTQAEKIEFSNKKVESVLIEENEKWSAIVSF